MRIYRQLTNIIFVILLDGGIVGQSDKRPNNKFETPAAQRSADDSVEKRGILPNPQATTATTTKQTDDDNINMMDYQADFVKKIQGRNQLQPRSNRNRTKKSLSVEWFE